MSLVRPLLKRSISLRRTFALVILLGVCEPLLAEEFQHEVGLGLHYYSGLTDKSLAPNFSTVLRFAAGNVPRSFYKWVTNLTILSGANTSTFDDAGTSISLDYTLLGGEFNFGFAIVPMASYSKLPVQPYFGVTGSLQVASLKFGDTSSASATFPKTDAGMFMGYALFVGVDIQMSKSFGMGFNVEQSAINGQVAAATFGMGGNRIFLNFFFR